VQYSTLELSEDVDELLRKHLRELLEVVADYLEPWVARGEVQCSNVKALVLALAFLVFSHQSFRRVFFDDVATPSEMLSAFADLSLAGNRS
jgi:hypothetical protein